MVYNFATQGTASTTNTLVSLQGVGGRGSKTVNEVRGGQQSKALKDLPGYPEESGL